MSTLPSGTVTFLFSDIEGSTRLVRELGPASFADLLVRHNVVMRGAFASHGGVDRGTQGDSFMAVFREAGDAIHAAVDAQRALASTPWPEGRALRVRIGLHTGLAIHGGDDYVGIDVNRAARVAAAAHGGQVLLSEPTRVLVHRQLPDGVRVEPLGSFRLKDLPVAEQLSQLEIRGLRSAFPPIRALNVRQAHLPIEATSFLGRDDELAEIIRLLSERRLVTLTGPGGAGKTRLAIRAAAVAAEAFADGAYFVGAAAIRDGDEMAPLIASALTLPQEPGLPAVDAVIDWLRERDILLVLDNLEQVERSGEAVAALLSGAPGLRVLATSRAGLKVYGEQEFRVAPLAVPPPGTDAQTLETSAGVRLFIERARLVDPAFAVSPGDVTTIGDVVRGLDGLPLAIELAAARTRVMSVGDIRERLARQLEVLRGGPANAPPRHRSLRDTIAWSHDLLDEGDRALFRRLGAFVAGWTAEAAEAVAGGPPVADVLLGLESLAAQSLIESAGGGTRFAMLVTLREYAGAELETAGERPTVDERHAAYYRGLAEAALAGSQGPARGAWFDRLEADLDNLKAAMARAADAGDLDVALGIAAALRPFLLQRNQSADGQRILLELVDRAAGSSSAEYGAATAAAAAIADWLGDYATARRTGQASVATFRARGERWHLADALGSLAFATIEIDPIEALEMNRDSFDLYRSLGDVAGQGQALLGRATALFALGRLPDTKRALDESLDLLRQAGDEYFAIFTSVFLGRIELLLGNAQRGMDYYREVVERSRAMDLRIGIAAGLEYLAEAAIWSGDTAGAVRLSARAARLKQDLGGGVPPRIGGALDALAVGRAQLRPDVFEREAAAGRDLDLDSAIAEALAVRPPTATPTASSRMAPNES